MSREDVVAIVAELSLTENHFYPFVLMGKFPPIFILEDPAYLFFPRIMKEFSQLCKNEE